VHPDFSAPTSKKDKKYVRLLLVNKEGVVSPTYTGGLFVIKQNQEAKMCIYENKYVVLPEKKSTISSTSRPNSDRNIFSSPLAPPVI